MVTSQELLLVLSSTLFLVYILTLFIAIYPHNYKSRFCPISFTSGDNYSYVNNAYKHIRLSMHISTTLRFWHAHSLSGGKRRYLKLISCVCMFMSGYLCVCAVGLNLLSGRKIWGSVEINLDNDTLSSSIFTFTLCMGDISKNAECLPSV